MNDKVTYPYAEGDLLVNRHTYQYSHYAGRPFLNAWREHRAASASELGQPLAPPPPAHPYLPKGPGPFRASDRLDAMLDAIQKHVWSHSECSEEYRNWIKKFEVTKRLFTEYNEQFRAVDRTAYRDLSLYVRYAEVMEAAYRLSGDVPALNVLLKVIDTLTACRASLTKEQRRRLAWLINAEHCHVEGLAGQGANRCS